MSDPYWANNPHNPANIQKAELERAAARDREMSASMKRMAANNKAASDAYEAERKRDLDRRHEADRKREATKVAARTNQSGQGLPSQVPYSRSSYAKDILCGTKFDSDGLKKYSSSIQVPPSMAQQHQPQQKPKENLSTMSKWIIAGTIAYYLVHELIGFGATRPPKWFDDGNFNLFERVGYILLFYTRFIFAHPW